MIEEEGRVVAVEKEAVWVETVRKSTCSGCNARNGCGQHLANKLRINKSLSYIRATSDISLRENDRVLVGIPEAALMKASILVYLIPLLLMMAGLWFGNWSEGHELVSLAFSLVGLAVGFVIVRFKSSSGGDMCQVKVVRVLSSKSDQDILIPAHSS